MISNRITKPTLIIDENICRRNIREMAMKCRQSGAVFRPHFKTHQSADIGEWFREEGIDRITVSSVQMAEYFARCGWKDILIAFPVNIPEIAGINKLAATIELHLLVESTEVVRYLIKNLNHSAGIYIKIDTGHHRTGILPDDLKTISEITSLIDKAPNLKFTGFLT
ncbi:MAG: alanine racemase, partial [Bacteroidetes bacterium]|nr:alanine racemase [Bacteroidota bacterium]